MTSKDKKFLKVAKAVSQTSDFYRIHIGAVIVKKNRIISVGCNLLKTHPIQKKYDMYRGIDEDEIRHRLHAEMACILAAKEDLHGATIYIYRKNRNGELGMCRPCPACYQMISDSGITRMVYTTPDGIAEEMICDIEL